MLSVIPEGQENYIDSFEGRKSSVQRGSLGGERDQTTFIRGTDRGTEIEDQDEAQGLPNEGRAGVPSTLEVINEEGPQVDSVVKPLQMESVASNNNDNILANKADALSSHNDNVLATKLDAIDAQQRQNSGSVKPNTDTSSYVH